MSTDSPDDLVMLVSAGSSFEAHILVAVLKNVGIEAVALDAAQTTLSMLDVKYNRVPIQVRRCDLERAAEALKTNIEDSANAGLDATCGENRLHRRIDCPTGDLGRHRRKIRLVM